MSDLTDEVFDAAVKAYCQALPGFPSDVMHRDLAADAVGLRAALASAYAAGRADERAKVGETIADAIHAQRRPGITAMLEGGWNHAIDVAAGIARQHAAQPESEESDHADVR